VARAIRCVEKPWCSRYKIGSVNFLQYIQADHVLFAIWTTGVIAIAAPLGLPHKWVPFLCLGGCAIGPIPIGLVTIFTFILWLRLCLAPRPDVYFPKSFNRSTEP
jgi:hypothetical protein